MQFFQTAKIIFHVRPAICPQRQEPYKKNSGPITTLDLEAATRAIILATQLDTFSKEIYSLLNGDDVSGKSRLISLKPFVDKHEILRVGGTLKHSGLPEEQKYPILLPPNHHVTRLIIREEHERLKHAGTQATLYSVRESFSPLNGRNITRMMIYECVRCFRARPRGADYICHKNACLALVPSLMSVSTIVVHFTLRKNDFPIAKNSRSMLLFLFV